MAIRAFLLCGDEKAVHAITQILDELEVSFEHSSEPPFALKRLSTQRFDLLIVDCDNVQNATQVFNSARASNLNKAAIAIAIVEGKAGVPNAFRLGASLVLTKPVSLEQARNTLRTGIGMTRKDTSEVKAPVPAVPPVTVATPVAPLVPVAPISTTSARAFSAPAPVSAVTAPAIATPALTPVIAAAPAPPATAARGPETTPKPAPSFAPVVAPTPASVAPVSEKPPVVAKPAVTPAPLAQEHKTALTDFTVPEVADKNPKPAVGVAAFAKAAAASTPSTASTGTGTLDPVRKEAAAPSEDLKSKPKPVLTKADAEDTEESPDAKLSISDPLAEEEETLDPLKDYGVPSFGGLGKQPFAGVEKMKRSGGKGLFIAAVVLALIGGGGYAAWITQPAFHDFATGEYGNVKAKIAEYHGEPQTAAAKQPAPVPPAPALAPAVAPTTPASGSEEINISLNPTSTPPADAAATPGTPVSPAANPPQISGAVADSKTQKSATVKSARQDAGHAATNPALVPASLPPTTTAKSPSSDLLDVPEDFADDQVIHRVHPVYPKQARVRKLQGTVVLEAIVNKQGKVDSLQLVSGDPVLAAAAADAVKQWRYKPYMHNGDFTDFQTRVTVDFKIPVSNP
jgi:protein TonB